MQRGLWMLKLLYPGKQAEKTSVKNTGPLLWKKSNLRIEKSSPEGGAKSCRELLAGNRSTQGTGDMYPAKFQNPSGPGPTMWLTFPLLEWEIAIASVSPLLHFTCGRHITCLISSWIFKLSTVLKETHLRSHIYTWTWFRHQDPGVQKPNPDAVIGWKHWSFSGGVFYMWEE